MKIRRISWTPYTIPFKADFRTAHGPIPVREGAILRLETDDGLVGLSDLAPLQSYNGATLKEALRSLAFLAPSVIRAGSADAGTISEAFLDMENRPARRDWKTVEYAVDAASDDIASQKRGLSVAALLAGHFDRQSRSFVHGPFSRRVAVNATVGATTTDAAVVSAQQAIEAGFTCVKLKVGMAQTIDAEVARVAAVRAAIGPDVELRLDANGAWTAAQAIETIKALEPFNIALVEQPVPVSTKVIRSGGYSPRRKSDFDDLQQVRQSTAISIAADEAMFDSSDAWRIIELEAVDVLVIKPLIVGSFRGGRSIIQQAEQSGLGVIVTSMLESGIGVAGALHLAATLRQPALACGLATTSLLEADLLKTPLEIADGYMRVPTGPGLGVELDEAQLAHYGGKTVVVE